MDKFSMAAAIEASLIMTRVSAGMFDDSKIDKTLLLNLELKRQERRRNLRYRTSGAFDLDPKQSLSMSRERKSKDEAAYQKTVDEYAKELEQWLKKMKCTGVTGIRLDSFADVKVGPSNEPLDPASPSLEPYPNLWQEKFSYKGYKDEHGRAKGRAELELENGDFVTGL